VGELERLRAQLGPDRVRKSTLCSSPMLVRWGDAWYLIEPATASRSGEYLRVPETMVGNRERSR
jgi:hypothetical protein